MQTQTTKKTGTKIKTKKTPQDYTFITGAKYVWKLKKPKPEIISKISNNHNLSLPIAHTLYSRDFIDKNIINAYLFSSYEQDVSHSNLLTDAGKAIERILKAIENKEKILIFGDYDVDGVTSTSLLLLTLIPLGAQINYYLPIRKKDGYGLSKDVVLKAIQNKYTLIITVDNGITAHPAAQDAHDAGIDVIITDHHQPHGVLPTAYAVVNPNQKSCVYPFKLLAGVGVTFKLMQLLCEHKNITMPEKAYELLALGTVADVVPLIHENRYWVRYGLSKINKNRSHAISVLAQNSMLTKPILSSIDVGFMIAPQINALGRLDDPREAVKFLISDNFTEVERIGIVLKKMNEERKIIEQRIYSEITEAIFAKSINLEQENLIMAGNKNWQSGVIGLVAGKLMHNFGKPTILFHLDNTGIAKGSCRSIPEFNIFHALQECQDLLLTFGGHACAAGLSLKQENVPELKERLEALIAKTVAPQDLLPKITLDAYLELGDATNKLMSDMDQLEPFGNQNPQPTFLIKNVTLLKQPMLLKDKHVKCFLFSNGVIKPVIFFNRPDIYAKLAHIGETPFDLAGHVVKNEWMDNVSIELQGLDIAINSQE